MPASQGKQGALSPPSDSTTSLRNLPLNCLRGFGAAYLKKGRVQLLFDWSQCLKHQRLKVWHTRGKTCKACTLLLLGPDLRLLTSILVPWPRMAAVGARDISDFNCSYSACACSRPKGEGRLQLRTRTLHRNARSAPRVPISIGMEEQEKKGGPALYSSHARQASKSKAAVAVHDCTELRTQDKR
jgi:hypothetical protein